MLKKVKIGLIVFLAMLFAGTGTTIYADTVKDKEDFFIDPSAYNKEISVWNAEDSYEAEELVLLEGRVYSAHTEMKGNVPGEDANWICVADLRWLDEAEETGQIVLAGSASNPLERVIIQIPVLLYNGQLWQNKYTYTVRCAVSGAWSAVVSSYITYDGGAHSIIKLDAYGDQSLLPSISQTKSYYYNNMTQVKVLMTGTYNGTEVNPATAILSLQ